MEKIGDNLVKMTSKELGEMYNREEGFFEAKYSEAATRILEIEHQCAELTRNNNTLLERCKKLASQKPSWPKGYKPRRNNGDGRPNRFFKK